MTHKVIKEEEEEGGSSDGEGEVSQEEEDDDDEGDKSDADDRCCVTVQGDSWSLGGLLPDQCHLRRRPMSVWGYGQPDPSQMNRSEFDLDYCTVSSSIGRSKLPGVILSNVSLR